jgi:CPA1 family monovalent cation:H+ antiporter
MRGIVTLAAALALPDGEVPFPHRDLIVFSAFCVVLCTLVVQGLTLRPLMQWLRLRNDGTVEREVGTARVETARAALRALDQEDPASRTAKLLRGEYQARLRAEESAGGSPSVDQNDGSLSALQQKAVLAQRTALTDLRAQDRIGDDAFHVVEEELDLLELTADVRVRPALEDPTT